MQNQIPLFNKTLFNFKKKNLSEFFIIQSFNPNGWAISGYIKNLMFQFLGLIGCFLLFSKHFIFEIWKNLANNAKKLYSSGKIFDNFLER